MKTTLNFLLFSCAACTNLFGQSINAPDTIFHEYFIEDELPPMLPFPNGDDLEWVNYDADQLPGLCVDPPDTTPFGWYLDRDFSVSSPSQTTNDAFTSCSFLESPFVPNANWLITSPIYLPDSSYWLGWRSLTYYGPGYHDGYKVLVSTTTNNPADNSFASIVFTAAEMVENSVPLGSLNIDDYVFSNGYIHANGYTDTAYFFIDYSEGAPFYHGKLEPHVVSLAAFAGQTVYIAFLHDSKDDYQMQVDDIVVSKTLVSAPVPENILWFRVLPNPAHDAVYFSWKMKIPLGGRLNMTDNTGKIVLQKTFSSRQEGNFFVEIQHLAPGIYHCALETAAGLATAKLVKM